MLDRKKVGVLLVVVVATASVVGIGLIALNSGGPYTVHEPIFLDGRYSGENSIDSIATREGWSGEGTVDDPYVISGLSITLTSENDYPTCIEILESDTHFWIEDCYFAHIRPESHSGYGVWLQASKYITVRNCVFEGLRYGIRVSTDDGVFSFSGNSMSDISWHGIAISTCHSVSIENNTFDDCRYSGIYVQNAVGAIDVYRNEVTGCEIGIQFDTGGSVVGYNTIHDCGTGIEGCGDGHFMFNNTITYSNTRGMYLHGMDDGRIYYNVIQNSGTYGIFLERVRDSSFRYNLFANNTRQDIFQKSGSGNSIIP